MDLFTNKPINHTPFCRTSSNFVRSHWCKYFALNAQFLDSNYLQCRFFLKISLNHLRVSEFLTICVCHRKSELKSLSEKWALPHSRQSHRGNSIALSTENTSFKCKRMTKNPFNSRFIRKAIRLSERASFPLSASSTAQKPFLRIALLQHGQVLSLLSTERQPKFRQMNSSQPGASSINKLFHIQLRAPKLGLCTSSPSKGISPSALASSVTHHLCPWTASLAVWSHVGCYLHPLHQSQSQTDGQSNI